MEHTLADKTKIVQRKQVQNSDLVSKGGKSRIDQLKIKLTET